MDEIVPQNRLFRAKQRWAWMFLQPLYQNVSIRLLHYSRNQLQSPLFWCVIEQKIGIFMTVWDVLNRQHICINFFALYVITSLYNSKFIRKRKSCFLHWQIWVYLKVLLLRVRDNSLTIYFLCFLLKPKIRYERVIKGTKVIAVIKII